MAVNLYMSLEQALEKYDSYEEIINATVRSNPGMWGFEEEIQDRKIKYEVKGEKGNFKSLSYVVKIGDLKLFCDNLSIT